MRKFTNSTVKVKLITFIITNSVLVLSIGLFVYRQSDGLYESTQTLKKNMESVVCQGKLDMMHDAIRSDVLSALLPNSNSNEIMSHLKEHCSIGRREVQEMVSPRSEQIVRDGYKKI